VFSIPGGSISIGTVTVSTFTLTASGYGYGYDWLLQGSSTDFDLASTGSFEFQLSTDGVSWAPINYAGSPQLNTLTELAAGFGPDNAHIIYNVAGGTYYVRARFVTSFGATSNWLQASGTYYFDPISIVFDGVFNDPTGSDIGLFVAATVTGLGPTTTLSVNFDYSALVGGPYNILIQGILGTIADMTIPLTEIYRNVYAGGENNYYVRATLSAIDGTAITIVSQIATVDAITSFQILIDPTNP